MKIFCFITCLPCLALWGASLSSGIETSVSSQGEVKSGGNAFEGRTPLVSFSDAYFSRLAFPNRLIRCKGVFKKLADGSTFLRPVDGELFNHEHLVHASVFSFIELRMQDGVPGLNSDSNGMEVVVEGLLSVDSDECSTYNPFSTAPTLLDCRILPGELSQAPCASFSGESSRIGSGSCYKSPCDEFRLVAHLETNAYYIVHYYSATLWMAYVEMKGGKRHVTAARPVVLLSTHPRMLLPEDRKKQLRVLANLSRLGSFVPSTCRTCCKTGFCLAKPYSQIKTTSKAVTNGSELARLLVDMFKIVTDTAEEDKKGQVLQDKLG